MEIEEVKKIGGKYGVFSAIIGFIAIEIFSVFGHLNSNHSIKEGLLWFTDATTNEYMIIGSPIVLILFSYLYGRIAAVEIIFKQRNYILVGFICGLTILITTLFFAGIISNVQDYVENYKKKSYETNIFYILPFLILYGLIPTFLIGFWFGRQVKRYGLQE